MACSNLIIYAPIIKNGSMPRTPRLTSPTTQTVVYSLVSNPSVFLELHGPEFNNAEKVETTHSINKLRGGASKVFRDSIWPNYDRLEYHFITNYQNQDLIITFLTETVGQKLNLKDYMGRVWQGIIVNPDTKVQRINLPFIGVQIIFEGVLISW
jgi:hypothetical protein